MKYRVCSHLSLNHYIGDDLELANMYADSVIEVESCFGYSTWPLYEYNKHNFPTRIVREQVCAEDIYKFVGIVVEV